ncbi:MAG: dTDP-glucose 4,6-dehydratase [Candidatus Thermoplasmatota archaeon]|jgi:dTDP-glucose 4,6-dehydratase|nr:dTDP-glucose 4,6-dehydratase [Candidatus Thermoplasmatota archaeon]
MSRLLVTGGYGFIGSNFVNYWLRNNPEDYVVNLDKMTYAADENYVEASLKKKNYSFVRGDIADRELVMSVTNEVDTVINFAAESHVDNAINEPSTFLRSNYWGVFNLLEASRKRDLRFHQISTDEVYGSLSLDSNDKFDDNSRYNPKNPYSATKAAADMLVRAYFNTYGVRATISNCSNNFGPHQHPEKLIPKTILNAKLNRKIPLYGDGRQIRDWIFVDDHVRGIEVILKRGKVGESYLISTDNQRRNIEVVSEILRLLKKDKNLIEFVSDRPGHDVRYALDSSKLKSIGWSPLNDFENSLDLTVKHYLKEFESYSKKDAVKR